MPTNIVDVSTFTDPIVGPASGDPRTAASVVTMGQGLANRTRLLKDLLDNAEFESIELEKVDTESGAETPALIHELGQAATSQFWLLLSSTIAGGGSSRLRVYQNASHNASLVITFNAAWDAGSTQWVKDATGNVALKYSIGIGGGFIVQFIDAGTPGPVADSAWNNTGASLGTDGTRAYLAILGWMATSVTPVKDTLYANNIIKAWASVTVASGVITLHDAFNVGTCSLNGTTDLRIPFRTNMANSNYCVIPGVLAATLYDTKCPLRATTHFDLRAVDTATQTARDLTATTQSFCVAVLGQQ